MSETELSVDWLTETIRSLVANSPGNSLQEETGNGLFNEKSWGPPLVGFANGADTVFSEFKTIIGTYHWTPLEAFRLGYPGAETSAHQLTVISWVLPHMEIIKKENREAGYYCRERWVRARLFGEAFNAGMHRELTKILWDKGVRAAAPSQLPMWRRVDNAEQVYSSPWSERHTAYACGMGTFGICDGLITPLGKAVRLGSLVAELTLPVTPRVYSHYREYCLFHTHGACGACIKRCPAGALSHNGHDKKTCRSFIYENAMPYYRENYGLSQAACGLCQTGVPCESRIPRRPR